MLCSLRIEHESLCTSAPVDTVCNIGSPFVGLQHVQKPSANSLLEITPQTLNMMPCDALEGLDMYLHLSLRKEFVALGACFAGLKCPCARRVEQFGFERPNLHAREDLNACTEINAPLPQ